MRHLLSPFERIPSLLGKLILRLNVVGSGRAIGPLSFWFVWQWLTDRYWRVRPVRPRGFLRYAARTYHGPPVTLADGTAVLPGDRLFELHLDNALLAARLTEQPGSGTGSYAWLALRVIVEDLASLAVPDRLAPEIKALHGVTLLARGARRLGFEVRPLPKTLPNDLTRFFMLGLLTIYSPAGHHRLAQAGQSVYPAEIWLSRRALIDRYRQPTP